MLTTVFVQKTHPALGSLGEQSDAYSHKARQNESVFPVRDMFLRFISLDAFFSAPVGRISPISV